MTSAPSVLLLFASLWPFLYVDAAADSRCLDGLETFDESALLQTSTRPVLTALQPVALGRPQPALPQLQWGPDGHDQVTAEMLESALLVGGRDATLVIPQPIVLARGMAVAWGDDAQGAKSGRLRSGSQLARWGGAAGAASVRDDSSSSVEP